MRAIVLLGVPGAGKGTVAEFVERSTTFRQLSTGIILREALREGTPLGCGVAEYIEKGRLVPDDVVMELVRVRLGQQTGVDYMFDGFPRTERQAELLDALLQKEYGTAIEYVFYLDVARDLVIRRLTGRLSCEKCGAVYHREFRKPRVEGICDHCGGALSRRDDDTQETIEARLNVFEQQTHGLIACYEKQGKLCRIDASGTPETVARQVVKKLEHGYGGSAPGR